MPTPGPIGTAAIGIGTEAANTAIGTIMGLSLEHHNDKRQLNQQQKLQQLQIQGQKEMADYNQQLQYDMWLKTNYQAQREQMEKAGLNPALLYGMSGGGGATTGGGYSAGVTGAEAPKGGGEQLAKQGMAIQSMQQAMQLKLLQAQKENIEADTANKQAQATKTGGIDTAKAGAETQLILANTGNVEADTKLKQIQTQLESIKTNIAQETETDAIDTIKYIARKTYEEIQLLQTENKVNAATANDKIKIVAQEAIGMLLTNQLTKAKTQEAYSNIDINDQTIKKMSADIVQKWYELNQHNIQLTQGQQQLDINNFKAIFEANYPGLWNVIGNNLQGGINGIFRAFTGKNKPNSYKP